jgi:hypothetical protein
MAATETGWRLVDADGSVVDVVTDGYLRAGSTMFEGTARLPGRAVHTGFGDTLAEAVAMAVRRSVASALTSGVDPREIVPPGAMTAAEREAAAIAATWERAAAVCNARAVGHRDARREHQPTCSRCRARMDCGAADARGERAEECDDLADAIRDAARTTAAVQWLDAPTAAGWWWVSFNGQPAEPAHVTEGHRDSPEEPQPYCVEWMGSEVGDYTTDLARITDRPGLYRWRRMVEQPPAAPTGGV